jgi:hypothetical protein
MSLLTEEIRELLHNHSVPKVIATRNEDGDVYAVSAPFLQPGENGQLVHLELLEKSETNRNLLRSLWYEKGIVISIGDLVIKGRPVKAHISGPVFRQYYQQVRTVIPDADLSTVWLIEPDQVIDETYAVRKKQEEEQFPFSVHLDRLTIEADNKDLPD